MGTFEQLLEGEDMKSCLVIAAIVVCAMGSTAPKTAEAALISPIVAPFNGSDVVPVQYRRRRTVVRVYRPRARYYGPGSGTGLGRVYTGPGSGTGLGRFDEGPGSGTGRGRW